MSNEGMMDWNARAADYPLSTDRPSILYSMDVIRREAPVRDAIVDIGCGPGNESIPFSELFEKVYSVDSSPNMLDRLRKECSERCIDNIDIIEADCLEAEVPGPCQVAFSCLCPGMFSVDGLNKLESLSEDLCIFVGHLYEEDCLERRIFEDAGLPFESRFDTLRIADEFREDRDITQARFADFPARRPEELMNRCMRIAYGWPAEEIARLEKSVNKHASEYVAEENNVIVLSWHKS